MKILSAILGFAVLSFALSCALSNQQDVALSLWPFFADIHVPLYLAGLAPLVVGFVAGGLWGWVASLRHRFRSRRLHKELEVLTNKIGELQNAAGAQMPVAPRKNFWRINK